MHADTEQRVPADRIRVKNLATIRALGAELGEPALATRAEANLKQPWMCRIRHVSRSVWSL